MLSLIAPNLASLLAEGAPLSVSILPPRLAGDGAGGMWRLSLGVRHPPLSPAQFCNSRSICAAALWSGWSSSSRTTRAIFTVR
jgi:hypothetical protein